MFEQKPVQSLVQDYAHFLNEQDQRSIEQALNQLSLETSTQILFVTVPSLLGYDKNDYATQLGDAWGVGGQQNNGIVFLIQPKTNSQKGEVSIQVGYGIEPLIPDVVAKRIIESEIIPAFKKGQNAAGVAKAIQTMMSLTKKEFSAQNYLKQHPSKKTKGVFPSLFIMLFFGLMIFLRIKSTRQYSIGHNVPFWIALGMMSSSSRSGGFSNFSSGGGGFGGFGGGSFGGGGAGGSW